MFKDGENNLAPPGIFAVADVPISPRAIAIPDKYVDQDGMINFKLPEIDKERIKELAESYKRKNNPQPDRVIVCHNPEPGDMWLRKHIVQPVQPVRIDPGLLGHDVGVLSLSRIPEPPKMFDPTMVWGCEMPYTKTPDKKRDGDVKIKISKHKHLSFNFKN